MNTNCNFKDNLFIQTIKVTVMIMIHIFFYYQKSYLRKTLDQKINNTVIAENIETFEVGLYKKEVNWS